MGGSCTRSLRRGCRRRSSSRSKRRAKYRAPDALLGPGRHTAQTERLFLRHSRVRPALPSSDYVVRLCSPNESAFSSLRSTATQTTISVMSSAGREPFGRPSGIWSQAGTSTATATHHRRQTTTSAPTPTTSPVNDMRPSSQPRDRFSNVHHRDGSTTMPSTNGTENLNLPELQRTLLPLLITRAIPMLPLL